MGRFIFIAAVLLLNSSAFAVDLRQARKTAAEHISCSRLIAALPHFSATPLRRRDSTHPDFDLTYRTSYVGAPDQQGYIRYSVQSDYVYLHEVHGMVSVPRSGSYLLALLRAQYPDRPIYGEMGWKNWELAKAELIRSPSKPDFSRVPLLRTLNDSYVIEPVIQYFKPYMSLNHLFVTLFPKTQENPTPVWLNESEVLRDPIYLLWAIQRGMQALSSNAFGPNPEPRP